MKHWTDRLDRLVAMNAYSELVEWARTQPDFTTAWAKCKRADWMLWLAGRCAGPPGDKRRKPLVLAVCECVEQVLWSSRSLLLMNTYTQAVTMAALQTAQAWAHGEASIEDVRINAHDTCLVTYSAVTAVYAYAAWHAADAAVYAAYDTTSPRLKALRKMADIVRRHYPEPPVLP